MSSPLYDSLKELNKTSPLWFDMPGHHGRPLPYFDAEDLTVLDRTEHTVTGDLFEGNDTIEAAEQLWAERWGAEGALFLTGGSTMGNHTALHLCCSPGDTVLADRGSHRSLWNGMALLDVDPVFLRRSWNEEEQITGPVDPNQVEAQLAAHPGTKAVFITSPTYYGVLSDIRAIADSCHRHGAKLIVDCAHGAHLPWIGLETPCMQGADLTVISAHKGLPAPGQTAVLLYAGFSAKEVCRAGSVYGSSSPSYLMMAAMDRVRDWLDHSDRYPHLVNELLPAFKAELCAQTPFRTVENDDPARLVISVAEGGLTGFQAAELLEARHIYPEMADLTHLVLITTCMDDEDVLNRLLSALKELKTRPGIHPMLPPPPEHPEKAVSLRQAMFAPRESLPLRLCEGRISADQIAPYPPGIPVIAPGERIEKLHLSYLEEIGYNIDVCAEVLQ